RFHRAVAGDRAARRLALDRRAEPLHADPSGRGGAQDRRRQRGGARVRRLSQDAGGDRRHRQVRLRHRVGSPAAAMLAFDELWSPIRLTLTLASVTPVLLLIAGTPISWWLARSKARWKEAVAAVVALPLVLPPTVLGFYLLVALGPNGPGGW